MTTKPITLRVSEEWRRRASNVLNLLAKPLGLDRSELIRQAIDQEELLFCHSPYVATSARHFVFVSGNGNLHYWAEEELRLLERRNLLPVGIRIKPPAQKHVLAAASSLDDIRSRWLVNYFSARDLGQRADQVRADAIDELGLLEKNVDLRVDRGQGVPLLRERLCAIRDFVREEQPNDTSPENASIPIEIPTLHLRIFILVDRNLYSHDRQLQRSARLGFDFRNLDSGRFQRHSLGFGANESIFYGEVFPEADHQDSSYNQILKTVQQVAANYAQRLHHLASPQTTTLEGTPVVKDAKIREQLLDTELPTSYLFGEFRWAKPYLGTVVNVTWNRPPKKMPMS